MRAFGALTLVVLAAGLLGVACGVPTDDEPRALAEDEIPGGPIASETTTTTVVGSPGLPTELWFVRDQEDLQASVANLPSRRPATVLEALVATVPEELESEGLTTAIPPGTSVLGAETVDGTLTVDLSEEFSTVSGDAQILAVAQIVLTATDLAGVQRVAFAVEGEPRTVTDATGAEQDGPVTAADYSEIDTFSTAIPG